MNLDLEFLKEQLHNPSNIRGFHTQLNQDKIKTGVDIAEIESQLLGVVPKNTFNIDEAIKRIMPLGKAAGKTTAPTLTSLVKTTANYGGVSTTSNTTGGLPRNFVRPISSIAGTVDPIGKYDYGQYKRPDDLSARMDGIKLGNAKRKTREVIKEIKVRDADFKPDDYLALLDDESITMECVMEIKDILDEELASYEGRTMVQDGIVVGAGIIESFFKGGRQVFGHEINLDGFADGVEIDMRNKKLETKAVHSQLREVVGTSPYVSLALSMLITGASTVQKNDRGTNSTKRAIQTKKKMEDK